MSKKTMKKNPYLTTTDIAGILGVSRKTAVRWLQREHATRKIGGRWKTSRAQFIAAFPELLREVAD